MSSDDFTEKDSPAGWGQIRRANPREVLVHLNIEVPGTDQRSADAIADAILNAVEVGSDDKSVRDLKVVCPLAEEV